MNFSLLKKIILTASALILVFCSLLNAQIVFEKSYGTVTKDIAHYVEITSGGGYILEGQTGLTPDEDIYLVKVDAYGSIQWSRIYSTPASDQGYSVKQTTDGGYILTGYILDTVNVNKMFLIKTDSSGNIEWSKIYSSSDKEEGIEVQQTIDGGYFIAGYQYNDFYFGYDAMVMRTDADGTVLWSKVYPTRNAEWGDMHLERTSTGDYYLTSIQTDVGTYPINENIYVLHIDSEGTAISEKIYGDSTKDERGFAVRELPSGNFLVVGSVDLKAMVFQIDPSGNINWAKKYENGYDQMEVWAFDYKPEAGGAITGLENHLPSKEDAFIFQIDENGNVGWGKVYGKQYTYYWEESYNIKITPDYGLVAAGANYIYGQSEWDMYLIKTDINGNTGCDSTTPVTVTDINIPAKGLIVHDSAIVMNSVDGDFTVTEDCQESTQCAGLNAINPIEADDFTVFPNPAADEINFTASHGAKIIEWKLFSLPGQLISDDKSGGQSMDVSSIPSGIYFSEITLAGSSNNIIRNKINIVR